MTQFFDINNLIKNKTLAPKIKLIMKNRKQFEDSTEHARLLNITKLTIQYSKINDKNT